MRERIICWVMLVMTIFSLSSCNDDENWLEERYYYYHEEKIMITLNFSK